MRSMGHPLYVYTPRSSEVRAKLSAAHKTRLGIPQDSVQIYGVFVPTDREYPLRYYASWVNQKKGWDEAVAFVKRALEDGRARRPLPKKIKISQRGYVYKPWPRTVEKRVASLLRRIGAPAGDVCMIYGIAVPRYYAPKLRRRVKKVVEDLGREAGRWIICEAWEQGWPDIEPKRRGSVDWDLVDILLSEHANEEEVAGFLGVSPTHFRPLRKQRSE